ncbi:MAG: hypothetical protein JST28_09230 [Acidobacteria bacterium]|nr:hypothetical protein [Acidobacteriota bacterium]
MKKLMYVLAMAVILSTLSLHAQGAALPTPTQHKSTLTWNNTCDTTITCTFNVYRCTGALSVCPTSGSTWQLLTLTPVSPTTYVDQGVTAGTTYQYIVYSTATINGVLQTSTPSNEVAATIPLGPTPVTVSTSAQ